MPFKDPEKKRAYAKAYHRKHMDAKNAYGKNYRRLKSYLKCPHGRRRLEKCCAICAPHKVYKHYISDEKRKLGELPKDFMPWELFAVVIKRNCFWCGRSPEEARGMGIDRRDNALPHTSTNVEASCADCNMMRRSLTMKNFLGIVMRIAKFRGATCGMQLLA